MTPLAIIHTESSCGWGGQEIRILTEAAGMLRRGHRVVLLCPPESNIFRAAGERGIPVVGLPIARKRLPGIFALRRWLAAEGRHYDIINTHSSTDAWLAALATRLLHGAPAMVRTRHVSSQIRNNRPTRWLYTQATRHIVTTGEALRQQLHRDNGFDLARMTSIPTGIDLSWFSPADRIDSRRKLGLAERPTLGILGTLRNWKGHVYLFQAFAELRRTFPDWQLLVIGDGPQRQNLQRLATELQIQDQVMFAGNRDDVPDWLNCLDVFALPSYGEEGVPQSIMQAMACGVPVVSTPVGAIGELVRHDETGLVVEPRQAAALAEALARLMRDPTLRATLAAAGLRLARERCGLDIMLDRMEEVFRQHHQK